MVYSAGTWLALGPAMSWFRAMVLVMAPLACIASTDGQGDSPNDMSTGAEPPKPNGSPGGGTVTSSDGGADGNSSSQGAEGRDGARPSSQPTCIARRPTDRCAPTAGTPLYPE